LLPMYTRLHRAFAVYITTPRGASGRYQNVPTFPISAP
jgi:hypothetical protein